MSIPEAGLIKFNSDGDGILYKTGFVTGAPPPLMTGIHLLRGKLSVPTPDREKEIPYVTTGLMGVAWVGLNHLNLGWHGLRQIDPEALQSYRDIKKVAELHNHLIEFSLTTGRGQYMHAMTINQLISAGLDELFSDYKFSDEKSSATFKCRTTNNDLKQGPNVVVVHIDDDPKAAEAVARVDQDRVLSILKRTVTTDILEAQIKRGKIEPLSPNVVIVDSLPEVPNVVDHFLRKVA